MVSRAQGGKIFWAVVIVVAVVVVRFYDTLFSTDDANFRMVTPANFAECFSNFFDAF